MATFLIVIAFIVTWFLIGAVIYQLSEHEDILRDIQSKTHDTYKGY